MSLLQFAGLVIAVTFILYAAWRIGFEDGRRTTIESVAITIERIADDASCGGSMLDDILEKCENEGRGGSITYADLVELEEKNMEKGNGK